MAGQPGTHSPGMRSGPAEEGRLGNEKLTVEAPSADRTLISVDMRHVCRRFVRRIWGQGWCINTIHITATHLLQLARKPGVGKDLELVSKERDFMFVRAALHVMRAIAKTGGRGGGARTEAWPRG